ncbi:S8 family peptidase [Algivirga pacifica]|uniref:S8 family peptidase n=2 Tax=Algivirga pacifica TaxID=1162670 RepID=A0ABP9D5K2_9BACT
MGVSQTALAQGEEDPLRGAKPNWYNLDKTQDGVYGIGAERAYQEILKGRQGKKVVVAVIDSGIDIGHEDLKNVIWVNKDEIEGNGKDDDNNGYVDDMHGWNFIGGPNGEHVSGETLELTREYVKLKQKYAGKEEKEISKKDRKEYQYFKEIEEKYQEGVTEAQQNYGAISQMVEMYERSDKLMQAYFGMEEVTMDSLQTVASADNRVMGMAQFLMSMKMNGYKLKDLEDYQEYLQNQLEFNYNTELNTREIVGDDYNDFSQRFYGNNDVYGPSADHGTHVAGIIGAQRDNSLGMKGVADNVEIMVVRAVPDGDERDKDVANAIRYAVDNGAQIINMSFGKAYSPEKKIVDDAVKYAMSKGVLLVHAAGNDNKNTDKETNFPLDKYDKGGYAKSWIEVGALNWEDGKKMPADFSNYAKKNVDLFAPGVDIYSTVPESKYKALNGTSMASPVVAGAAAVLMSYYPEMTAAEVKKVLMRTVTPMKKEAVYLPGYKGKLAQGETAEEVKFGDLSVSGGILNLYEAVKYAEGKYGK